MRLFPFSKRGTEDRRKRPWYWPLVRIVRTLLLTYVIVLVLMMFLERPLIFPASRYPDGDWTPGGREFEDVFLETPDGVKLHGWFAHCDEPRAVVLYCHGNGGSIAAGGRAAILRELAGEFRCATFMFDYRGYGRSEGKPSERGILIDARAARHWLAGRTGVSQRDVVLMGRSLGGAVAVDLAVADGARGVILESTFTSMPAVAAHHYPWLPVRLLMRTRLDSESKIGGYQGPLLQSHSAADEIIPFELGRRLHEAANGPKRFIVFDRLGHNDWQPPEYGRAIDEFLDELPQTSSP